MKISGSETEIPERFSNEFFKNAIENGLKLENVTVEKFDLSFGSAGGENYCSDIYRAKVSYTVEGGEGAEEISFIIKCMRIMPSEDKEIPTKEIAMYQEIVPELEKLLADKKVIFSPKCFYTTTEPTATFVFEDLNASGFELADRVKGLDEDHCKIVLRKIAQFHAASMVLAEKNPDIMKNCQDSFFTEMDVKKESEIMKQIFVANIPHIAGLVESWPGFEDIAPKLRNLGESFLDRFAECMLQDNYFKVLNHGDLWTNNFLFKYDKSQPIDISFIDLQLPYYGGPALDLNYFLNTSLQLDVLKTKRYDLLRYYFENFTNTLKELDYKPIPTWEQLRQDIRDKELFAFWTMESIFPLLSIDKESSKDSSLEAFETNSAAEQKRNLMFSSPRVIETLKYSLFRFDELGVLDY